MWPQYTMVFLQAASVAWSLLDFYKNPRQHAESLVGVAIAAFLLYEGGFYHGMF